LVAVLTEQITSRQNPLIKRAARARARTESGLVFVEGVRLVEEAIASRLSIDAVIFTGELADDERGRALLADPRLKHCRGAMVPELLMRAIADVEAPQGVVALAHQPYYEPAEIFGGERPVVVALEELQDPGNVGTIVRAAEAAGASGIALSPGTADPYGPKALRASMGSAFRLPLATRAATAATIETARARGLAVYATAATAATRYDEVDWSGPACIVVGNEGAGLSDATLAAADEHISIPVAPSVESLNAAVATAVILFEIARQRRK
jgi:TrmH family RNA methyltransferase